MQEELITFDIAKLAKEKGFNLYVERYYMDHDYNRKWALHGKSNYNDEKTKIWEGDAVYYSAPTQSLLQRWLRDIYFIHIEIYYMDDLLKYGYKLTNIKTNTEYSEDYIFSNYNKTNLYGYSYEQALEKALLEALKHLQ